MPRRPRRLWRRPRRLRRAGAAARRDLPGRQPRSRGAAARSRSSSSRGAPRSRPQWTRKTIKPETREFLESLEPAKLDEEVGLYHASPRDPVWEYVLSPLQAELCLDVQPHRICLIGHSHVALSFSRRTGSPATGETRGADEELDLAHGEWLINPGSVGQPRDGDPRAAWLELDFEAGRRDLPSRRVRHRRGRGRDPSGPSARFPGRSAGLRPVRARSCKGSEPTAADNSL